MLIVRTYAWENREYLLLQGKDLMPGMNGIRLLADRMAGVGADCVLVFTGTQAIPSFLAFNAEGERAEATSEDYKILIRYLADEHIAANPAELARIFGDQVFVEANRILEVTKCEVHLTNCFVARVEEADAEDRKMIG